MAHEFLSFYIRGRILDLRLATERRRYKATPSLIGWAHTYTPEVVSNHDIEYAGERNLIAHNRILNNLHHLSVEK